MTRQNADLVVNPPSLPKQGGAISTAPTSPVHAGSTGDLQFSIPCPVTEGRGLTPSLALSYKTSQGNGPFGVGWQLPLLSIRLHTKLGTPRYDESDYYVGPAGEVLEPARDSEGAVVSEIRSSFGSALFGKHEIIRYYSRVSASYERYERWRSQDDLSHIFWLVYGLEGSVHCLGMSPAARTQHEAKIAEWMIEETLSPQREHIRYVYRSEDDKGIDTDLPPESTRQRGAGSYLSQVLYANVTPYDTLYCLDGSWPDHQTGWLFSLVFDYGERHESMSQPPPWTVASPWLPRADPFSDYRYGFEVRSHRLCHQVILFHHFSELSSSPTPVRRLVLTYDENPVLSRLVSSQIWSYGENTTDTDLVESHPPLLLNYQSFSLPEDAEAWQVLPPLPGINDSEHYQLVDLYGEGLPGILYRYGRDWRYRSPRRAATGMNAIEYSDWDSVPSVPSFQGEQQALMDITGTGRLDWMVMYPGFHGFFSLNDDHQWTLFTPFSAVPSELFSGEGVFADIVGAGLSDVAVIGPHSVRFYCNTRQGFGEGQHMMAEYGPLPIQGRDARTLVAFSDVLGTGQSHLIEVTENAVHCWPNLGRGRFGEAIILNWSGVTKFQPRRIFFVDVDGTGANDLIYAHADKLTIYHNQSGNGFATGVDIPLPEQVVYDDTCQLSFADIEGTGGMCVLLTVPHLTPTHFLLPLCAHKPYLIHQLDNQCGALSEVTYRHSGQEWLDEKEKLKATVCALPLPVYLVKQLYQTDLVTGNQLKQEFVYRHGVYDGKEREFRGFAYVETLDAEQLAGGSLNTDTPPLKTCRWYHIGYQINHMTPYWEEDPQAYTLASTLFQSDECSQSDQWWVERALVGELMREEVYGLDGNVALEGNPYTIVSRRYQVSMLQPGAAPDSVPVLRVKPIEQLHYRYERVSKDPVCQHSLTLLFDEYDLPLHEVSVHYPRRAWHYDSRKVLLRGVWDSVYPGLDSATEDEQQFILRLSENLHAYYHDNSKNYVVIGLPLSSRSNVIEGSQDDVPEGGFCVENLIKHPLLSVGAARHCASQEKHYYADEHLASSFTFPPRRVYTEEMAFDDEALTAYQDLLTAQALDTELTAAGYVQVSPQHSITTEPNVWAVRRSLVKYADASQFYVPVSEQSTPLSGINTLNYDVYCLRVLSVKDALDNEVLSQIDYQSLATRVVTDTNKNTRQVASTPQGYPAVSSFYGTENGESTGFDALDASIVPPFDVSTLIEQVGAAEQNFAVLAARDTFSWAVSTQPLHQVMLTADTFPGTNSQKVQVQVVHSDGFGRLLQSAQKVEPGMAYQRTKDGELALNDDGSLVEVHTDSRWRVSGRIEYNNKGLVIRQYQPFFVDDWQYVADSSMRAEAYADTHFYDALGRLIRVLTAKGYERRQYNTSWHTIAEDENDTWSETVSN
ncbi:hypothetical protein AB835_01425 [Candidatus Endobugula sertula]|uniref:Toxin n=1 Tax=Candidatus Endobugula sertula TaxID=62101 RepID=A0A1D2QTQ0_9GAMM|nr:hypothetical protein AB835_01425 [Candidatus Endobugula sertula]